jgi:hypothetical protein
MNMKSNAKIVAPVQRAKGGRGEREPDLVSGNPEVIDEAEERTTGDEDTVSESEHRHTGKKHGGKAKHHKHGGKAKHHRKTGGKVIGLMTGGPVRSRLDRPGRKMGGGVGSNKSPLSTAHNTTSQDAGSSDPKDTYGGTPK